MLTSEELRQIRRLSVQAGRRVDSLFAGGYRSAFRGRGMEFEEVRLYVPGDDVRHIDWNVTARAQEAWVKEFREEREEGPLCGDGRDGGRHRRFSPQCDWQARLPCERGAIRH